MANAREQRVENQVGQLYGSEKQDIETLNHLLSHERVAQSMSLYLVVLNCSATEFRHWMRSGDLLAYLSQNCHKIFMFLLLFHLDSAHFSEIQLVSYGRTDGHTLL